MDSSGVSKEQNVPRPLTLLMNWGYRAYNRKTNWDENLFPGYSSVLPSPRSFYVGDGNLNHLPSPVCERGSLYTFASLELVCGPGCSPTFSLSLQN